MLSQFPDPGMFMHSLNDQVKMFNCGFKHVVGIQTCGGDSGLSDLLNLFSHLKEGQRAGVVGDKQTVTILLCSS